MRRLNRSVVLAPWLLLVACSSELEHAQEEASPDDDGSPVVARRLNRVEYDNTVRDLLGTTQRPAIDFPDDDRGLGFDNIGALLVVSPELAALYERAAESLAAEAITNLSVRPHVFSCRPEDIGEMKCIEQIVDRFVPRAWRRPLQAPERERLLALYAQLRQQGDDFDVAVGGLVQAALMSPHFLFRVETEHTERAGLPRRVGEYELASRLSYFLWNSMPDDELFELAAEGVLGDDAQIERQVHRMLEDERSVALVDDFAGQWLQIRALDDVFKDATRYPLFDDDLRIGMKLEMSRFFASFLIEDRPLQELLLATTTTVDRSVAQVYGVATPSGSGPLELDLTDLPRRGLLTMPGLMTVLARPFRTAPSKRGAWVLSALLCAPIPPPPDGVEGLMLDAESATPRQWLAIHRDNPSCAGCHAAMDPIGLAFEHYDGVGAFRTSDEGQPIDASGTLPSGETFANAVELAELLADDERFVRCVVRQTMTYALGRALTPQDEPHLEAVTQEVRSDGDRTRTLLVAVAKSVPFRHRYTEDAP